ncbi:PQQ-binding-like beta-propeller repeat protein [Holospora curviuscula]|uniref:Outer membrane protein assembly factor BamB n=1 Tax=Holospora curviuscula TaxID=1082868 RepID=A0A2S5R911_9PROT|nr:PQQ-binding-like beta-propeller repeat protein [Holospora curviuscula]PPE03773.1 Outer membrane protein assembly factor BamB precursor [Holospora curviuscula]
MIRRLILGFLYGTLLWSCTSEVELPPLMGKRENLVVEEVFSMTNQQSKNAETEKFVPCSGKTPVQWLQYYCDSTHQLPALGDSFTFQKKREIPKLHQIHVSTFSTQGAAPSPVCWRGQVYVLKGLKLYEGVVKEGIFTLLRELDLSGDVNAIDMDGMGGIAIHPKGLAFITLGSSELVCVCLKNQRIMWRRSLECPAEGPPVLGNGKVICVTRRNQTVAFRQKDGEILWSHQGAVEDLSLWGGSSAAISRGIVISNYSSNQVAALNEKTGTPIWTQNFAVSKSNRGKVPHQKASPVYVDELVYVLTHSNLACLVASSGQTLWQWPIGGYYTPLILGNFLFVVDQNGVLSRLDRYTGKVCWTHTLPSHKEDRWNVWIGPWYVNHQLLLWRYDGLMVAVDPFSPGTCGSESSLKSNIGVFLGHPLSASGVLLKDAMVLHSDDGGILSWKIAP